MRITIKNIDNTIGTIQDIIKNRNLSYGTLKGLFYLCVTYDDERSHSRLSEYYTTKKDFWNFLQGFIIINSFRKREGEGQFK